MNLKNKTIPTIDQAEAYLDEAGKLNPGPWVVHSRYVAQAMRILAAAMKENDPHWTALDPQRAFALGLLHDIGRREGVYGMRHVVDGYRFLDSQGYPAAGRVCLTHSYPEKDAFLGASGWDGRPQDFEFIKNYLAEIEYDAYDWLVQLGDVVCMSHGYVLIEKRMLDVALRYGLESDRPVKLIAKRWQAYFNLKNKIEKSIGSSIYEHLPGVRENTFRE